MACRRSPRSGAPHHRGPLAHGARCGSARSLGRRARRLFHLGDRQRSQQLGLRSPRRRLDARLAGRRRARRLLRLYRPAARRRAGPDPRPDRRGGGERRRRRLGRAQARRRRAADGSVTACSATATRAPRSCAAPSTASPQPSAAAPAGLPSRPSWNAPSPPPSPGSSPAGRRCSPMSRSMPPCCSMRSASRATPSPRFSRSAARRLAGARDGATKRGPAGAALVALYRPAAGLGRRGVTIIPVRLIKRAFVPDGRRAPDHLAEPDCRPGIHFVTPTTGSALRTGRLRPCATISCEICGTLSRSTQPPRGCPGGHAAKACAPDSKIAAARGAVTRVWTAQSLPRSQPCNWLLHALWAQAPGNTMKNESSP